MGWALIPGSPDGFFSSVAHDAATALVVTLGVPAGAYNVTDDEPLRRRELFDSLAAGLRVPPPKTRLNPGSPRPVRVDTLPAQFPESVWQRFRIVEGSKGPLIADFAALRAVTTRHGMPGLEVWVLMRRAIVEPGAEVEVKVYLSNVPAETQLAELVRVSGLRWPIEC